MATIYIDAQEANRIIESEAKACVAALIAEQARQGIKSYSGELRKIRVQLLRKNAAGIYSRIRFTFPRYGVFVEKGAVRGRGGAKGSKWLNKRDIEIYTNPEARNKMNTGGRRAKEWFNPVIEHFAESLTEKLQKFFITVAYQRLKIK